MISQPGLPPKQFFETRLNEAKAEEATAQSRFNTLAISRLAVFVVMIITAWFLNRTGNIALWAVIVILIAAFLFLMRKQAAAKRNRDFQRNIQAICDDEKERLSFRFTRPENGLEHTEKDHAFAGDLDIFGEYSLYKLLNRTRTAEGSRRLANWLKNHADIPDILARQEAATEVAQQPEYIQEWEATALLHAKAAQQIGEFRAWYSETLPNELTAAFKWRWFCVITLLVILLSVFSVIPGWTVILCFGIHLVILRRFMAAIQDIANRTGALGKTLVAYAELLELAENAPFRSSWWQTRKSLISDAGNQLKKVGSLFEKLDYRNNVFFLLFVGIPTLWDLHCLASLENWKQANREKLNDWLDVLADIEALNSISGYAFANPGYIAPKVSAEGSAFVEAIELGHPLIPFEKRISNDFSAAGTGHTILITGSNMSGKSTFLRTVGLTITLAQMGAVVAAKSFSCSPFRVFSSMRTQDSLEESTSSFYAELKRLRRLLELAGEQSSKPVFYLLDEILKGTNSADRHRGAEALIRQLHTQNAFGMVSTHDLELGEWGDGQPYVRNYHFRSDVGNGKLDFDYRLHNGICQSFNASELMRMMGINIK